MQKTSTPLFEISAKVIYVPSQSQPDKDYHFFAYKMGIKNLGNTSAQLLSRHWIITDAHGATEEVRGAGVVGLQPHIQPGQLFEYDSACPLKTTTGSMKGRYYFVTDSGEHFNVEIPEFFLVAPTALH